MNAKPEPQLVPIPFYILTYRVNPSDDDSYTTSRAFVYKLARDAFREIIETTANDPDNFDWDGYLTIEDERDIEVPIDNVSDALRFLIKLGFAIDGRDSATLQDQMRSDIEGGDSTLFPDNEYGIHKPKDDHPHAAAIRLATRGPDHLAHKDRTIGEFATLSYWLATCIEDGLTITNESPCHTEDPLSHFGAIDPASGERIGYFSTYEDGSEAVGFLAPTEQDLNDWIKGP